MRTVLFGAAAVAAVLAAGALPVAASAAAARPVAASVPTHCHSAVGLPDHRCTPGVAWWRVRQQNIGRTICKSGWTSTIRPPGSYTGPLKITQIHEYGYSRTNPRLYEEDHLIPLELGGAPRAVKNLWPEFANGHRPNPKDEVENALKDAVCDGTVKLARAQRAIAKDWKTAKKRLGL
jgi:hypothetical protein